MMRACSSVSGGVMFIPDEIEKKTNKTKQTSYKDLAEPAPAAPVRKSFFSLFGKKKSAKADLRQAA